jgi:hypothetical protein
MNRIQQLQMQPDKLGLYLGLQYPKSSAIIGGSLQKKSYE